MWYIKHMVAILLVNHVLGPHWDHVCNILWISDKFGRLWYINVVCDILVLICGLWYIYMLCCLHGKAKKKNFRGGFPECLCCGTRGRRIFFKKKFFPECLNCSTRQRVFKKNSKIFPECCTRGRKKNDVGRRPTASSLPRVPTRHSAKPSPNTRFLTLGEGDFPVRGLAGGSSPSVTGPSPSATGTRGSQQFL